MLYSLLITSLLILVYGWLVEDPSLALILAGVLFPLFYFSHQIYVKRQTMYGHFHAMYYFLHQLIMSLSLNGNVYEAYKEAKLHVPVSIQHAMNRVETSHVMMTLEQFHTLFPFPIYRIGLKTIQFYDDKGGNVLSLFESYLKQLRIEEVRLVNRQRMFQKYSIQFMMLWGLNLGILLFARLVLSEMFSTMREGVLFLGFLSLFFFMIPFSFYLWIRGHA